MSKTPKGRTKKVSDWSFDEFIERGVKRVFKNIPRKVFYAQYWGWLPLLFIMTSPSKEKARYRYRIARMMVYQTIKKANGIV